MTPDEARAILARDPLKYFNPSPTQDQFLRRPLSDWACLNTSVSRGGKTSVSCVDLAWIMRGIHPYRPNYTNLTLLQFTPSRLQAANVIGAKLFKKSELILPDAPPGVAALAMIPPWEIAKLNEPNVAGMKVPYELIMKNGNRLLFSWSGVDGIAKRIAGLRIDGAYVDEDAGTPQLFDELYTRLLDAQSDATRPGLGFFVWSNTNLNYNEAFESFQERHARGVAGHRIFTIGKNENPAISSERREAMKDVLSTDAARIRMEGDMTGGAIASIYHKQWGEARHVLVGDYNIKPEDNLWVGYDPGVDHPMGMIVGAINRDQPLRINITKCWNSHGETIEKDADNLRAYLSGRQLSGFVYDTNLKNRDRGGGPSVLDRLKDLLAARGIAPMAGYYQSKKNHAPGIALVRHYLDPNPDDRTVPPLLILSQGSDVNGVGMLRRQILAYRGREATRFTGPGGVVKKDDELVDALRYLIMARPSYNPSWACGKSLQISTQRVDNLNTGCISPSTQRDAMDPSQPANRFDFQKRVFLARSRDRRGRGMWHEASL